MKTVTQKFRNTGGGENTLKYTHNPMCARPHIVSHRMHAGECSGDFPEVYRYETVETARKMWAKLVEVLKSRGYEKV
jgi:hypothetical protein